MRSSLLVGVTAFLTVCTAASAGERHGPARHGHPGFAGYGQDRFDHRFDHDRYGYGGYGFADAAIGGDYIGAPLTRFPRPGEIVPPVWGYGTYGVPTMTGIRQAPVGDPTLYVIRGVGPAARRSEHGSGADAAAPAGGARVVSVTVPRR